MCIRDRGGLRGASGRQSGADLDGNARPAGLGSEQQLVAVAAAVSGGSGATCGAGAHDKLPLNPCAIGADGVDLTRVDAAHGFNAVADIAARPAAQGQRCLLYTSRCV